MLPPAPIIPTYKKSSGLEGLWPHYRESIEKSLFEIQKDLKNKKNYSPQCWAVNFMCASTRTQTFNSN